jgi:hypothetical protein
MQVISGQCLTPFPQGLGVSEKPVPTPPSSAGRPGWRVAFFASLFGEARKEAAGRVCKPGRGKIPANLTPNTGTPARKSPTQEAPLFAPACTQPGARRRTRVNTAR